MSKADDLILANGPYPPAPAVERRLVGLTHHPTIWEVAAPMVATLPTGSRVNLPAGTVLREGTGAIDHRHLLACARGVVDHDAAQALTGPVAHALLSALRAACGDSIEDVAVRAGLPREMAPTLAPPDWGPPPGVEPDPLAALTLAAYNAARSGLDRGIGAKAGVAALMTAYTAGVERAIADHAKPRT